MGNYYVCDDSGNVNCQTFSTNTINPVSPTAPLSIAPTIPPANLTILGTTYQEQATFTPSFSSLGTGLASASAQGFYYIKTGFSINLTGTVELTFSNGTLLPSLTTPLFVCTVPYPVAPIFGSSTRYFVSNSTDIYQIGFVSTTLGNIVVQSPNPLPQSSLLFYITGYNNAILGNPANGPFYCNFNFTYYTT